jgi:ABC-2 type transport system ATP-binding protein
VIELDGVRFSYGRRLALRDVSGQLGPGVVGLVGVNGAGKTTLLRILATLKAPHAGVVTINGRSPQRRRDRTAIRGNLGYLPQDASWSGALRVREFLTYFAWLHGVPAASRAEYVGKAIAAVDLTGHAGRRLEDLSGGEYRRAMIAQAVVHRPGLLLLDEPTAGLDPRQRVALRTVLRKLSVDRTIVVSTHLMEDLAATADQIAVLHEGVIVFNGDIPSMRRLAYSDQPGDNPLEQAFHRIISRDGDIAE